ncbi:MAG: SufE family protein [Paludibacteraceae bacterium]|jgi:cysteine desulfuration protein SufE|nr:SufE family protein [Paludibacteraceae bacterium]
MSINELQDGIIEEFEAFDDWIDRYQLIIDYAKELNNHPFPDADRNSRNLIDGCQSPVWFTVRMEDGKMIINGDSDAQLVKGMVALLIHVLSGHTPREVLSADLYFIDRIGLREHLSPTRSNGVAAMLKQLKLYALAYSSEI